VPTSGARRATDVGTCPRGSKIAEKMNTESTPEAAADRPQKKRRFLSPEKKFQIYLEAQGNTQPIGEILRREGLFSTDLARIRLQVKEGALTRLGAKSGAKPAPVNTAAYDALKLELQDKERTLADLSVELSILKKKVNGNSWDR